MAYKYKYNTNAFDKIETEEDAYWLGFILADGYVAAEGQQPLLQIKLANRDKSHLVKFISYMGYETTDVIKDCYGGAYTKDNLCNVVKIKNKQIVNNLHKYNLNGAKSGKECPYSFEDDHLTIAYIRGIFDGDGYISQYDKRIGIVGSYETCSYVKNFIEKKLNTTIPNNILEHGKIFRINFTSEENANNVLNLLYNNASIYLDRKYELYLARQK